MGPSGQDEDQDKGMGPPVAITSARIVHWAWPILWEQSAADLAYMCLSRPYK